MGFASSVGSGQKKAFTAKLTVYDGEKQEQFSITNQEQAETAKVTSLKAAKGKLRVDKVEKRQRKRNPAAPFITSTLQQEAARKLGFTVQRAMRFAQQLYEGVDIGFGFRRFDFLYAYGFGQFSARCHNWNYEN